MPKWLARGSKTIASGACFAGLRLARSPETRRTVTCSALPARLRLGSRSEFDACSHLADVCLVLVWLAMVCACVFAWFWYGVCFLRGLGMVCACSFAWVWYGVCLVCGTAFASSVLVSLGVGMGLTVSPLFLIGFGMVFACLGTWFWYGV